MGLNQKPVRIADLNNAEALTNINPNLRIDKSYDMKSGNRTQTKIVVPIKSKNKQNSKIQVLFRRGGGAFTDTELRNTIKLGFILGRQFRYALGGTLGPCEYLVQTG